jgi:hypothetical protein
MGNRVDAVATEVEQRQDRRLAGPAVIALMEAGDLIARVPGRGRQKADPRDRLARQLKHQTVQSLGPLVHGEAATAHCDDATRVPSANGCSQRTRHTHAATAAGTAASTNSMSLIADTPR